MRGDIFYLKSNMAQSTVGFFMRNNPVLTTVIKQFQTRAVWQGKVEDVKITAIDGLKMFEAENPLIEIERFLDINAVDRDVVDVFDVQIDNSGDDKLQPIAYTGCSILSV